MDQEEGRSGGWMRTDFIFYQIVELATRMDEGGSCNVCLSMVRIGGKCI